MQLWIGILARKLYEQLRQEAAALMIQKNFRRYIVLKSYSTVRSSAITLQTGLRAMTARNEFRFRKQTKAAIIVQVLLPNISKNTLSWNTEKEILQVSYACCKIKIHIAFITDWFLLKNLILSSCFFVGWLQARLRCHIAYSYHKSLQKAALVTQCSWRRRIARKELRMLKMVLNSLLCFFLSSKMYCIMHCAWGINSGGNHWCKSIQAARETGALKEAKDKLEKRVEELTWRLQLEKRLRVTIFLFILYINTKYGIHLDQWECVHHNWLAL